MLITIPTIPTIAAPPKRNLVSLSTLIVALIPTPTPIIPIGRHAKLFVQFGLCLICNDVCLSIFLFDSC
ncbi:unnamed protein product [Rotaria sordida]|uniref:Uncharacterized protein n=2 Tax=Rotaria sordida TaxID=392033 RepID=A0A815I4T2_9BILA|nr:unnamed protein product [Rotaria sordida]CAF1359074.1 unnamed protein product [Rotaria sordida]CAF3927104.1 unnamed protein product [Rotaria sordida]